MKRRWKYLLAVFLLAAGVLTGCAEQSVQPQNVQNAEIVEAEVPEAETTEAEIPEAEITEAEVPEAETTEEEVPGAETEKVEATEAEPAESEKQEAQPTVSEDGTYTSKEEVAEYIFLYGHLPDNFITKKEAKASGWISSEGNLGEVAPGMSIGGDYFGNFEGNLPEKEGREYHECDIDSDGGYRGAKRIVYSNDGLIYYTEDHYKTFELLYGEDRE